MSEAIALITDAQKKAFKNKLTRLSAELRRQLLEMDHGDPEGRTKLEVIAARLIERAIGDGRDALAATALIFERTEGKAPQTIVVESDRRVKVQQLCDRLMARGKTPQQVRQFLLEYEIPESLFPAELVEAINADAVDGEIVHEAEPVNG